MNVKRVAVLYFVNNVLILAIFSQQMLVSRVYINMHF